MTTHENQITNYPKGARIEAIQEIPLSSPSQNYYVDPLPRGTRGVVTAHTDDGRAWINFDGHGQEGFGHTFHEPEKYIRVVCSHRDDNCPANQMSRTSDDAPAAPERGDRWTLSKPLTNQILADDLRRGGLATPIYGIDIPEDSSDRTHFGAVVIFGDSERAAQIVTEHNQHSTLIAQRERLLDLLKQIRAFICEATWTETKPRKREAEGLVAQIDAAITTSEQEGRTQ